MLLSDKDYYDLTHFIGKVLIRVRDGQCSADEGTRELMHFINVLEHKDSESRELCNAQSPLHHPASSSFRRR